jgi:hypothetical protein
MPANWRRERKLSCEWLDGYIQYTRKREGDPSQYEAWKQAICSRVKEKLAQGDSILSPGGGMGRTEVEDLQEHLVFLKEDRAPYLVVSMCKYRYMYERCRYLQPGHTFEEDVEG